MSKRKAAMQDDDSGSKRLKLGSTPALKARPKAGISRTAKNAGNPSHASRDKPALVDVPQKLPAAASEAIPSSSATPPQQPDAWPTAAPKESTSGEDMVPGLNVPKPNYKRKKLAPARPWPIVPTSVTASGPRSSHTEGKNYICITRKTKIGAYLRRCKDVILKDGYKTLHLSALGAAIPLLTTLTTSLPSILPFAADQIQFEYKTGTVQVQDELIPEAEEDDVVYETRGKSNLTVIIHVDGGDGDVVLVPKRSKKVSTKRDMNRSSKTKANTGTAVTKPALPQEVVFQEPDQDDMDSS